MSSNRGKIVILVMIAAALAAGLFGVWHQHRLTRRSLAWWGAPTSHLIAESHRAEGFQLVPTNDSATDEETLAIGDRRYEVVERADLTNAKGFTHVRRGLVEDANFDWDRQDQCQPNWQYAIRFIDGNSQVTLAFDPKCQRVIEAGQTESVSIAPVAEGLSGFLAEQFGQ